MDNLWHFLDSAWSASDGHAIDQPELVMISRLHICVCGWYFYEECYRTLASLPQEFEPIVIAHRPGDALGLPLILRNNVGLEFGAYACYLDEHWDRRSNVLFMHDDVIVPPRFFSTIEQQTFDQAYIFASKADYERDRAHGRAMYTSARFLHTVLEHGGIWYDAGNTGFIASGPSWSEKPPPGCQDHNAGIRTFMNLSARIGHSSGMSVNQPFYAPYVQLGRRGQLPSEQN